MDRSRDRLLDRGQRFVGAPTIRSARLSHVGPPAPALAAQCRRAGARQVDRGNARGEVIADRDHQRCLAIRGADQRDHARADLLLDLVGHALEVFGGNAVELARRQFDPVDGTVL